MSTLLSHNANLSPCHTEVSIPNLQSRNMVAPGGGSFKFSTFIQTTYSSVISNMIFLKHSSINFNCFIMVIDHTYCNYGNNNDTNQTNSCLKSNLSENKVEINEKL